MPNRKEQQPNIFFLDKTMAILEQRFDMLDQKLDGVIKALECLPNTYATKEELTEAMSKFRPYTTALNMIGGAFLLAVVGGIIKLISTHGVL